MAAMDEPLDRLLHKATAPVNSNPDWTAIKQFADKIAESDDGIQSALRLLVHRIQSSNEQEALNALLVLNTCVDSCGLEFQEEIGKFRFLNELIKLVSPKYLGNHTAPKVKTKVIELLFNWSENLREQSKIKVAYEMLKKQKVVINDPIPETPICASAPPPKPRITLFEDEEKAKLLQKLLHSNNRDDVQAANRLIKSMVKEDERRVERSAMRLSELETVNNTVKVLTEMLVNYQSGSTSSDDVDVIKEIYQTCERLQPNMFRAASEADDKDEHLGEILKANDDLTKVIEDYKNLFSSAVPSYTIAVANTPVNLPQSSTLTTSSGTANDISLLDLDSQTENASSSPVHLVDDQMLLLDDNSLSQTKIDKIISKRDEKKSDIEELEFVFDKYQAISTSVSSFPSYDLNSQNILIPTKPELASQFTVFNASVEDDSNLSDSKKSTSSKGLEDIDLLGLSLLKQALPPNASLGTEFNKPAEKLSMNQLRKTNLNPTSNISKQQILSNELTTNSISTNELSDLTYLFVPLETVKPANVSPLTLYDKNGVNVVLHFSKERPKSDVTVVVVTTINKNADPVSSLLMQFDAGKEIGIKLQPSSNTQLPGFNPILPLAPVTQIMLIASHSSKVNMSYRLSYKMQDRMHVEAGEIELSTAF